jgi:hypothetical protein
MPVEKYRSVAEMPPPPACAQVDDACLDRIRKLWARSAMLAPRIYPRGVFKFRNLEEAQAARLEVERQNVERLAREQGTSPSLV